MKTGERELEVKFYLEHPGQTRDRLEELGASLVQPREHEVNLRFDTPDGALKAARRVLRLRQPVPATLRGSADPGPSAAVLTFKGPADLGEGIANRQEIETIVHDLEQARHILEALGYQVAVMYEKYRTVYLLEGMEVTLDDLPYGNFAEIEGASAADIRALAERLGLSWECRIVDSYLAIFDRFCARRGLSLRHLSFEEFTGLSVTAADLDLSAADSAS